MAALTFLPPINLTLTTSLVDLVPDPGAGFMYTFNIRGTIISGTTDGYCHVWSEDIVSTNDGWIMMNEPIRYAVPGGSPDLVVGYQLLGGYKLRAQGSASSIINLHVYNLVKKQIA